MQAPIALRSWARTGVVYGDIGTSPLYALEQSLMPPAACTARGACSGVLSLMFWACWSS